MIRDIDAMYTSGIQPQDKEHLQAEIDKIVYDPDFEENYEYNGNFAVVGSYEEYYNSCSPCCGIFQKEIECPSGNVYSFCFDYGH